MTPYQFNAHKDGTMRHLETHWEGELVGRKPFLLHYRKPKSLKSRQAASVKLGKSFLKKLERMGL